LHIGLERHFQIGAATLAKAVPGILGCVGYGAAPLAGWLAAVALLLICGTGLREGQTPDRLEPAPAETD